MQFEAIVQLLMNNTVYRNQEIYEEELTNIMDAL